MSRAQVIHELGPPEVMQWEDWPLPDPEPGEVRLRHKAIGVNFADTYRRLRLSRRALEGGFCCESARSDRWRGRRGGVRSNRQRHTTAVS